MKTIEDIAWDEHGQAPVIVQDVGTGAVLAMATMDRAALAQTLATGWATYAVPAEGNAGSCAAAGTVQMLTAAYVACDGRAILLQVQPAGPLCRTGATSCFYEPLMAATPQMAPHRSALTTTDIVWSPEAAQGAG